MRCWQEGDIYQMWEGMQEGPFMALLATTYICIGSRVYLALTATWSRKTYRGEWMGTSRPQIYISYSTHSCPVCDWHTHAEVLVRGVHGDEQKHTQYTFSWTSMCCVHALVYILSLHPTPHTDYIIITHVHIAYTYTHQGCRLTLFTGTLLRIPSPWVSSNSW